MRVLAAALAILAPSIAAADPLCVTSGAVEDAGGGLRRVESASFRAVVPGSDGSSEELRFRYEGPSADTRALGSGVIRRQIGLKLRAHDACNLLYVMWRLAPGSEIVVSIKRNPGQSRSAECGNRGYANVAPAEAVAPPPLTAGRWRDLRAEAHGDALIVTVDGRLAWRGTLPGAAQSLAGPAGLRSDNVRFTFSLRTSPGESGARCDAESEN